MKQTFNKSSLSTPRNRGPIGLSLLTVTVTKAVIVIFGVDYCIESMFTIMRIIHNI